MCFNQFISIKFVSETTIKKVRESLSKKFDFPLVLLLYRVVFVSFQMHIVTAALLYSNVVLLSKNLSLVLGKILIVLGNQNISKYVC